MKVYDESSGNEAERGREQRGTGGMGGQSSGIHIPGAEGTAMFFCPGLVARVPEDYINDQLQGILGTADKNDLDDDGEFVDPDAEKRVATNNTNATGATDVLVGMDAGGESGRLADCGAPGADPLNCTTVSQQHVDLDSPECSEDGVVCALLTPVAQIEFHVDQVPFLEYIIDGKPLQDYEYRSLSIIQLDLSPIEVSYPSKVFMLSRQGNDWPGPDRRHSRPLSSLHRESHG